MTQLVYKNILLVIRESISKTVYKRTARGQKDSWLVRALAAAKDRLQHPHQTHTQLPVTSAPRDLVPLASSMHINTRAQTIKTKKKRRRKRVSWQRSRGQHGLQRVPGQPESYTEKSCLENSRMLLGRVGLEIQQLRALDALLEDDVGSQFPASTWQFTCIYNSSSKEFNVLFSLDTNVTNTNVQAKLIHVKNKNLLIYLLC